MNNNQYQTVQIVKFGEYGYDQPVIQRDQIKAFGLPFAYSESCEKTVTTPLIDDTVNVFVWYYNYKYGSVPVTEAELTFEIPAELKPGSEFYLQVSRAGDEQGQSIISIDFTYRGQIINKLHADGDIKSRTYHFYYDSETLHVHFKDYTNEDLII